MDSTLNLTSIISRPRKSLYEAILIDKALNIIETIFNNEIDFLQKIEKIDTKFIQTGFSNFLKINIINFR